MKTQLLEDIGENTTSSPAPSRTSGNAPPAKPRPASGVWRQKPSAEPPVSPAQTEESIPVALDQVFEEIAALEAQFVPPAEQHAPAAAAAEPRRQSPAAPAETPQQPAASPAEAEAAATSGPTPAQAAAAPQEPRFDFTPPGEAPHAANPFTPAGSRPTRTGARYLLWGGGVIAAALLVLGGRWFYQEHNDARSLALIAGEAKQTPRDGQAVPRETLPANGAAAEPEGEMRATPAVPARVPSPPPPLVMLEADPPAARSEAPSDAAAGQAEPSAAPRPEPAAHRKTASPSTKATGRTARAPSGAAAGRAKEKAKRAPARQLARASAATKENASVRDTSMTATLKACREHGYHATQCIKQQCSVTQYGFACRGPG